MRFQQSRGRTRRARLPEWSFVSLEKRLLLTSPGYVLEGTQWPNPSQITYSIVPDGTTWDQGVGSLVGWANQRFGAGVWEYQIAKALATWESVANINISEVADSGAPFNSYGPAQGDPGFGDIRLAGYDFQNPMLAAQTYPPPPGGWTAAGDSELNTAVNFSIGSGIDLYSVELHEMGHALGLGESPDPWTVMYQAYQGVRSGLAPGDIAGIQRLYGPRTLDAYQQLGQGTSPATSINVNSMLNSAGQGMVGGVELGSIGDTEYFSFTAPSISGTSLTATAAAAGQSLLSPEIQIFNSANQLLAQDAQPAQWGNDVTANVSLQPGAHYIIAVKGATNDVFAAGAYQLALNVNGLPAPGTPPQPTAQPQGDVGVSTITPDSQPAKPAHQTLKYHPKARLHPFRSHDLHFFTHRFVAWSPATQARTGSHLVADTNQRIFWTTLGRK